MTKKMQRRNHVLCTFFCLMAALFAGSALAACEEEHVHVMTYISATEATCTQEGVVEHWNCTECGKNYSDEEGTEELSSITIAALGHDFGPYEVETAPTCTEEGVEASICSRCSEKQTRTVAALGHEWGEGVVTTEPTCSREGVRTYSCSRCEEEKTEAISALAHTPGEAVRENEVAATCTSDGSVDIVVSCTVCGEEISRETETIKALGHSWNSGIVTSYPSCTQAGQRKYTCTRCSDTHRGAYLHGRRSAHLYLHAVQRYQDRNDRGARTQLEQRRCDRGACLHGRRSAHLYLHAMQRYCDMRKGRLLRFGRILHALRGRDQPHRADDCGIGA